ncbi:hypothetical protein NC652_006781 [Populus alba x Populus x berolinensis]|nr:hypothetical protein NC652_006781 [Populus alba x Populus x berolinensis]
MRHSAAVWDYRAAIEHTKDWNGMDQVVLRNPQGASARWFCDNRLVCMEGKFFHGGMSKGKNFYSQAVRGSFKPPKQVRGGIPICFPQFGNCGPLEQHGFARSKVWTVDDNPPPLHPNDSHGKSFIDLLLKPSEEDLKCWPYSFELRLRVSLAANGDLALTSRVRNIDGKTI